MEVSLLVSGMRGRTAPGTSSCASVSLWSLCCSGLIILICIRLPRLNHLLLWTGPIIDNVPKRKGPRLTHALAEQVLQLEQLIGRDVGRGMEILLHSLSKQPPTVGVVAVYQWRGVDPVVSSTASELLFKFHRAKPLIR